MKNKNLIKISRSKIELFLKCKRCFYLTMQPKPYKIHRPGGCGFSLNVAVDLLLKRDLDFYRAQGKKYPFFKKEKLNLVPYPFQKTIDKWRKRDGLQYTIAKKNIIITGELDDVLFCKKSKKLFVVEYKATSKKNVSEKSEFLYESHKKQVEVYQWLLRKNGFDVSNTAYFLHCNGKKNKKRFYKRLSFKLTLIPYSGNDLWIDTTINDMSKCLKSNAIPLNHKDCEFCNYANNYAKIIRNNK